MVRFSNFFKCFATNCRPTMATDSDTLTLTLIKKLRRGTLRGNFAEGHFAVMVKFTGP